jgi:Ca2+-binding RTX toxin-like protein
VTSALIDASDGNAMSFDFRSLTSYGVAFNGGGVNSSAFRMTVYGGNAHDSVTGGAGNDTLDGGAGNDTVAGGGGNDSITGGTGNDSVDAGAGNDTIISGTGGDSLLGGDGADVFRVAADALTLSDTFTGGTGVDTLELAGFDTMTGADFTNISGIETVKTTGNQSGFSMAVTSAVVDASDGNAMTFDFRSITGYGVVFDGGGVSSSAFRVTVYGGSLHDSVTGVAGSDTIVGGGGNDSLSGGGGADTASFAGGAAVTVSLATGTASGQGSDTLSGIENLLGSSNGDSLTGNSAANLLNGGAGADTLNGGTGADIFRFASLTDSVDAARDRIGDFNTSADRIHLIGLGFTGIRSGAGSGSILGRTYDAGANLTYVSDADSTFSFALAGNVALDGSDFIFS